MTAFVDRLHDAIERTANPSVVGLDPHLALLPDEFAVARDVHAPRAERADAVARFLCEVIDAASDRVPAVKPQSAFFEALGADGVRAFEEVVAASRDAGLIVIGDVKRGDIGSTAAAYAKAFLTCDQDRYRCDAVTLNPYLGTDSLTPFVDACREIDGGAYVLVRTSNPSSADLQTLEIEGGGTLSDRVADLVSSLGAKVLGQGGAWSSIGAVVGATHPDVLASMRARMPKTPFLLPGFGAQGASARDVAPAFTNGLQGALVNSSRGILFAGRERPDVHWKDAARRAMDDMAGQLREAARS